MLKRELKGEITVGFCFASLFWIAVLVWATSFSPTDSEKEACYQAAAKWGRSADECKSFWEKTTSDPLAAFTFVLAFSTIGLWGSTIGLYWTGEKQIGVAKRAADAAMLNARAAIGLQLPIIKIKPSNLSHGDGMMGGEPYEDCSVPALRLQNIGENKGFLTEILYGFTVGEELPKEPEYRYSEPFTPIFTLEPDPQVTPEKRLYEATPLKAGEWAKIQNGNYLWFYCAVIYADFMGETRSQGFCWRSVRAGADGLSWREYRAPAYNRKIAALSNPPEY